MIVTKAKSNALESLRALIAERQQYEGWIATLESKRSGTSAHVFDRVSGDYHSRLDRVVADIRGHAEELQLSISALSSRLAEVAREEDTRRDAFQESELRAEVGEYDPQQWEQLRTEAQRGLDKVGADRSSLENQLAELRSIQKLSEVGSIGDVGAIQSAAGSEPVPVAPEVSDLAPAAPTAAAGPVTEAVAEQIVGSPAKPEEVQSAPIESPSPATTDGPNSQQPVSTPPVRNEPRAEQPSARPASPAPNFSQFRQPPKPLRPRTGHTPPFGVIGAQPKSKEAGAAADQAKTLKCPECGTPNYATEWYCERCGGELATM